MDELLAHVSLESMGVVGLCVLITLALMTGKLVPGSRVAEVRAHYESEIAEIKSSRDAVVAVQTVALATERESGDKAREQNLRIMGYVEAAMKPTTVHSGEEAAS